MKERERCLQRKRSRDWYERHKNEQKVKEDKARWFKAWYERNKLSEAERSRIYRIENPEKVRAAKKKWYRENPEKVKEMRKKELKAPGARVAAYMRTRVRLAILSQKTWKRGKTLELLGCSVAELKDYLESNFHVGMSWDNYGRWHIDHIRPCSSFDLTQEKEQKLCFHYSNLQPLWATDNLKKHKLYESKV